MLRYVHACSIHNIIVMCQQVHSTNSMHALTLNLAMIHQRGTPTWFFSLSAADVKWPDVIQTRAKQWGVLYTVDEVCALSFMI